MATPSTKSPAVSSNKNPVEPPKVDAPQAQADTQPTEPAKVEPQGAQTPAESPVAPTSKATEKTIISLSVPEKLARQVRLLSKLEGKSISAIFLDAVASDIPSRLRVALASIVED